MCVVVLRENSTLSSDHLLRNVIDDEAHPSAAHRRAATRPGEGTAPIPHGQEKRRVCVRVCVCVCACLCVCVCVYGLETRKDLDLRRVGPRHLCVRPP